jgi:(S)-sulfolactate dehydrogenase
MSKDERQFRNAPQLNTPDWVPTVTNVREGDVHYARTVIEGESRGPQVLVACEMSVETLDWLSERCDVHYRPTVASDSAALIKAAASAVAIVVDDQVPIDGDLLSRAPQLKAVGCLAATAGLVDVRACERANVLVFSTSAPFAQAVAEYVLASAMLLRRGVFGASLDVAAGHWPQRALSHGRELLGATLGIIGFGAVGQHVAALAQPLGLKVLAHDPAIPMDDALWAKRAVHASFLGDLLRQSDIISIHLPSLPGTHYLIDEHAFATMKPGALLINTSHGKVLDEAALVRALEQGQIGGAVLDRFSTEPLAEGSPLARLTNVLLTPHIAGRTQESMQRASRKVAEQIAEAVAISIR